jgi:endonuclease-3
MTERRDERETPDEEREETEALKEKALRVSRILDRFYGRPLWRSRVDPLSELVLTILSQATSDTNSGRAFESLRARFPTWEEVAQAPVGEVADAIRSGGLANQKAPRIQAVLREIAEKEGVCSLDRLYSLSTEDARAYLSNFHGVGPKTIACVLMFGMGRPVLPVDTHVHRVTRRLGLIPPKASAERAHDLLQALIPPYETYAFHVRFIRHGRKICHAQNPDCAACPLLEECPDGQARVGLAYHEKVRRGGGRERASGESVG